MKLLAINGPNLNLLGSREPDIYGAVTLNGCMEALRKRYPEVSVDCFQSNIEGELVDALQRADGIYDGVLLNPGGYTHTSVALADAVAAVAVPVVEVHLSSILGRESFRRVSLVAPYCLGTVMGFGPDSYALGVESFKLYFDGKEN